MSGSQGLESSQDGNRSLEQELTALQIEYKAFKLQSLIEKQRLIYEKDCAFSSLKELLLHQAREVDRVQNKVAGMKARAASITSTGDSSDDSNEADVRARINLVETSLSDLRHRYEDRANMVEQAKAKNATEKQELIPLIGDLGDGANATASAKEEIKPTELRSEIATLQNLQTIVSNFYTQLLTCKDESEYQFEVAMAYEKLASTEKRKAVTEQALATLRTECEANAAAIACERKRLLEEKDYVFGALKQLILLLLRDAQSINFKLSTLKARSNRDDESGNIGFEEMKARLKLAETSLMAFLRELEEKRKTIESAAASSNETDEALGYSASFSKVRRLKEVLVHVTGQLKEAESLDEKRREETLTAMRDEITSASSEAMTSLRQSVAQCREENLKEKENSFNCMRELLRAKKTEADLLRTQLTRWKEEAERTADIKPIGDLSGIRELHVQLRMLEKAFAELEDKFEKADEAKGSNMEQSSSENADPASSDSRNWPTIEATYSKVQNLNRVLATLQEQFKTLGIEEEIVERMVLSEKDAGKKRMVAMQNLYNDERETAFACLTEVVILKQSE